MGKLVYVQGFAGYTIGEVFNFNTPEMKQHLKDVRINNRAKKLA